MSNQLKILSWNLCWGCMKADHTSQHDVTARTLALECLKTKDTNNCLNNVVKLIENDSYDFIGLQEAAKYEDIIAQSSKLQAMGCIHHALTINNNIIDLVTFYNHLKFKVLAVKIGNINFFT